MCKTIHDTCESNYTYTMYIAEIWNSISSLSILYSTLHLKKTNNASIIMNNVYYKITSISLLLLTFHVTLLYKYQLLSNILITILVVDYIKILLQLDIFLINANSKTLSIINKFMQFSYTSMLSFPLLYYYNPFIYIVTFNTIGYIMYGIIGYILYFTWINLNKTIYIQIYEKYDILYGIHPTQSLFIPNDINRNDKLKDIQGDIRTYLLLRQYINKNASYIIKFYTCATIFYFMDIFYCNYYTQFLPLYGIYYILSSFSLYYFNIIIHNYIKINSIIKKDTHVKLHVN